MKNETTDIYEMLDTLSLPVAAQRFVELSESPELGSYTLCSSSVKSWSSIHRNPQ